MSYYPEYQPINKLHNKTAWSCTSPCKVARIVLEDFQDFENKELSPVRDIFCLNGNNDTYLYII